MLGLPEELGKSPDAPLRVLALGAHADDIEIGCGGTLLRLVAERPYVEVHWAVLSGAGLPRESEALASANAFLSDATRSHISVASFRDGHFPFVGSDVKDYIEDNFKSVEPHIVFTHAREDGHQDHRLVSDLAWNTFRGKALIAEYEIPKWDGDACVPNAYVRIDAATADGKVALLMEHFASQHDKPWYDAETFRGLLRLRGVEAACQYAEAFTCRKLVW